MRIHIACVWAGMCASTLASFSESAAGPIQTDPALQNKEWIGVVSADRAQELQPLLNHRLSQGRSGCIWTIEDIGASFGGTFAGPQTIKAALQHAWNTWTVRPRWVVIFADHVRGEDYDPLFGRVGDFRQRNAELAQVADSNICGLWPLMDLDDDGRAELVVGRVPASLPGQASNYVEKVIQHDTDIAGRRRSYRNSAMLVQDEDEAGNSGAWARALADSLYVGWDAGAQKLLIHSQDLPCCGTAQRQAAIDAWNAGPGFVTSLGTANNWFRLTGFWNSCATSNRWSVGDLAADNLPALLGLSCAMCATDHPTTSSCDGWPTIADDLLLNSPSRGAVAVIGPMRATIQFWNFLIGKHLMLRYYGSDYTWGEVFANALNAVLDEDSHAFDHVYQYVLLGDPAALANPGSVATATLGNPEATALGRPRPSPASVGTIVSYDVAKRCRVRIAIVDVVGRVVKRLVDSEMPAGAHEIRWGLESESGEHVAPGLYFVRLSAGGGAFRQRVVIVR